MRSSLLLRSLLASALTLTLGLSAGTLCGRHQGHLRLFPSTASPFGYVVSDGYAFGVATDTQSESGELFYFDGCQGDSVTLNCSSCGSSQHVVALMANGWDTRGDPNDWLLYDAGVDPSLYNSGPPFTSIYSSLFIWDSTDMLYPVTYNSNGTVQTFVSNAQYIASTNTIQFNPTSGSSYYLSWAES